MVETNTKLFNGWDADVIVHDVKVAVLWNGPWHRRKIKSNHSVAQVQNRDKIKCKEIERYGYCAYTIDDPGKADNKFVEEKFNLFLSVVGSLRVELRYSSL